MRGFRRLPLLVRNLIGGAIMAALAVIFHLTGLGTQDEASSISLIGRIGFLFALSLTVGVHLESLTVEAHLRGTSRWWRLRYGAAMALFWFLAMVLFQDLVFRDALALWIVSIGFGAFMAWFYRTGQFEPDTASFVTDPDPFDARWFDLTSRFASVLILVIALVFILFGLPSRERPDEVFLFILILSSLGGHRYFIASGVTRRSYAALSTIALLVGLFG